MQRGSHARRERRVGSPESSSGDVAGTTDTAAASVHMAGPADAAAGWTRPERRAANPCSCLAAAAPARRAAAADDGSVLEHANPAAESAAAAVEDGSGCGAGRVEASVDVARPARVERADSSSSSSRGSIGPCGGCDWGCEDKPVPAPAPAPDPAEENAGAEAGAEAPLPLLAWRGVRASEAFAGPWLELAATEATPPLITRERGAGLLGWGLPAGPLPTGCELKASS